MFDLDISEKELKRLLTDFGYYLNYVYSHVNTPAATPLQMRLAEIIQNAPSRLILEAARGVGKSWITAIYASWRLLRDNDEKVLIVSANTEKAKEIASFLRRLFSVVPLLKHLEPSKEVGLGTDKRALKYRDSATAFDVKGCNIAIAPSVAVVGISGQLTGKRATLIIADDVEVPKNSATTGLREKLITQVKEFEALLVPDKPSTVLFLGTPQSMESIYNKLPYQIIVLPAMVPEDESIYNGNLDPWVMEQGPAGTPTDKIRFPLFILKEREAGYGVSGFKLQYLLDTTLSDINKFPLKFKDCIIFPLTAKETPATFTYSASKDFENKELISVGFSNDYYVKPVRYSDVWLPYDKLIMAIDPSGKGVDETTYSIIGLLNGMMFLIDVGGTDKGYSDEAMFFLATKAREFGVHEIVIEENFGSGMFAQLFKNIQNKVYNCKLIDFKSKGQKEIRIINAIEPITTNHKLIVNEAIIQKEIIESENNVEKLPYTFIHQFTHLTKDRNSLEHDDRLDAVAIGIEHLKNFAIIDPEEELKRYQQAEMERFLFEKIYNKASSTNANYIH